MSGCYIIMYTRNFNNLQSVKSGLANSTTISNYILCCFFQIEIDIKIFFCLNYTSTLHFVNLKT